MPRLLILATLPLALACFGCNRDAPDETSSAAVEPGPAKQSEPETPPDQLANTQPSAGRATMVWTWPIGMDWAFVTPWTAQTSAQVLTQVAGERDGAAA